MEFPSETGQADVASSYAAGPPALREVGTIVAVDTIRWELQPNLIWVRLHTSTGLSGLGETYYLPGAVEQVVHDLAAGLLIGQGAADITRAWSTLFSCANFFGYAGAEMRAFSAIDVAMWDVLGRAAGLPCFQLLGGKYRDAMPVYNTCVDAGAHDDWRRAVEEPGALARELAGLGYLGMKVWPWDRFAPQLTAKSATGPAGWSAMGPVGTYLSRQDLATGLKMLEDARDAAGFDLELLVEGHGRWDINMALRVARAVEPLEVLWMEDICQPDSAEDLARLVRESRVPQAVSERLISRFRFREVLDAKAAHVVLVDVAWAGGLSEARRIAEMAEAHHLPFAPHDCTGPVTALANLHLASASPNCIALEVVRGFIDGYYREVLDEPFAVEGGKIHAPSRPGLGADFVDGFTRRSDVTVRSSR